MINKRQKLLQIRSKLQKGLRGSRNEADLSKIKKNLSKVNKELKKLSDQANGTQNPNVNINTIGGLQFQASSPPGIGRMVSLPFYPVDVNLDVTTASGIGLPSTSNPVCIFDIGNSVNNAATEIVMQTPQISWATLRIVGFEVDIRTNTKQETSKPTLLVSDLKVGGGTNLFTHEDFSDGSFYSSNNDYYAGLRDYPLLVSPNTARVKIGAISPSATGDTITFSAQLVCEVLSDENYGVHIPGPYARGASMIRAKGV